MDKRSAPETTCETQKCREYVCRYYHDGAWWGLNITAYDVTDAENRVAKLGGLQLQGELIMTIPASRSWASGFAKHVCGIRNWMAGEVSKGHWKERVETASKLSECIGALKGLRHQVDNECRTRIDKLLEEVDTASFNPKS